MNELTAQAFEPTLAPDTLINAANAIAADRRRQFDELGELGNAPLPAVTALRREIEDDDTGFKDFEKRVVEYLLDRSDLKRVIVQMKGAKTRIDPLSVRGKLAEMIKALKATEDAAKPPERNRKRLIMLDCGDTAWKKIESAITKAGTARGAYAEPRNAEQIARVMDVIAEIERECAAMDAAMQG